MRESQARLGRSEKRDLQARKEKQVPQVHQGLPAVQAVLEQTMSELDRLSSELQGLRGQLAITVRVVKQEQQRPQS